MHIGEGLKMAEKQNGRRNALNMQYLSNAVSKNGNIGAKFHVARVKESIGDKIRHLKIQTYHLSMSLNTKWPPKCLK